MSSINGFLSTLILFQLGSCILAINFQENVFINKCPDFKWDDELHSNDSITIPGFLMAKGNTTEFRLSEHEFNMDCNNSRIITLHRNFTIPPKSKRYKLRGEIYNHFTKDGFLMIDSVYYDANSYCVLDSSNSSAIVKVCDNISSSENTKGHTFINIPKCCGLGQELVYWNYTCQNSKNRTWTPQIYTHSYKKMKEGTSILRYSRPLLTCDNWERWPLSQVRRPKNVTKPPDPKLIWRILKDGSVVYRDITRIWIPLPKGDFCVDSFANWGIAGNGHYSGLEEDQVILLCPDMQYLQINQIQEQVSWIPYLYASFLFLSSIFLLLTSMIHFALIDKLPVHGLTVLSHSVSMFLMYIFLGMAYFTSAKAIDNAEDDGVKRGFPICIAIGILAHFFFIATFVWLTIMNFDLWWTFRIVKPMGQTSKRMTRFRLYSGVGWGLPISLISTFVGLDFSYRDITSDVKVPDYGIKSCFVACYARGLYIYYILASLIFVNLIFIISTCITFINFQRNNQTISSKKTTNFKLFTKLFFIMGVAWCFELYSWIQIPCNSSVSWHSILLDLIMFLQAAGNFVIFCCNERIVSQLEEKFPQYKKALRPIKKLFCLKSPSTTGEGYGMGAHASGSTLRKLSTTTSLSVQTDQTQ